MAEKYNILEWYEYFKDSGDEFSLKDDAKEGGSTILSPGCFYILKYKSKTPSKANCKKRCPYGFACPA